MDRVPVLTLGILVGCYLTPLTILSTFLPQTRGVARPYLGVSKNCQIEEELLGVDRRRQLGRFDNSGGGGAIV
jgi:hypothetical protein